MIRKHMGKEGGRYLRKSMKVLVKRLVGRLVEK